MTSKAVAEAVVAWAVDHLPALRGSYDFPAPERDQGLPDVMAAITGVRVVDTPPDTLPGYGIQQVLVKVRDVRLILAVDPTDAELASEQVESFSDTLSDALLEDNTLGGRVAGTQRTHSWSFEPPFIEFDDGTRARQASLTMTVAEPIPARTPTALVGATP